MLSGKAYVWFKRMNHNPNMYYYCPHHLESISQDIYSTNSNGDFLDDCIDSDEEVNFSYCQKILHVIQESSYEDNSDYDSCSYNEGMNLNITLYNIVSPCLSV